MTMNDQSEQYNEDYFLHGKEKGLSLYENYRWMPDLTIPMVQRMVDHLDISFADRILDFGCARGYAVRAFRELGYTAYGYDTSKWALENADEKVYHYLSGREEVAFALKPDWIIAKDVLEHVPFVWSVISNLMYNAKKGVFAVVPLSAFPGNKYVIEEYEKDVTHCQRMSLLGWVDLFLRTGWYVEASYRVPGIKDNWYKPGWEKGNGFITARRIKE